MGFPQYQTFLNFLNITSFSGAKFFLENFHQLSFLKERDIIIFNSSGIHWNIMFINKLPYVAVETFK